MAPLKGELGAKRSEGLSPKGLTSHKKGVVPEGPDHLRKISPPLASLFSYLFIKKGVFPLDCNALKCYDSTTKFERGETTLSYVLKEGYPT